MIKIVDLLYKGVELFFFVIYDIVTFCKAYFSIYFFLCRNEKIIDNHRCQRDVYYPQNQLDYTV